MVRESQHHVQRVRLAPADWGGLCSLVLSVMLLLGVMFMQLHDFTAASRAQQARFEAEIAHLKRQVARLQDDMRVLLRRNTQPQ